MTHTRLTALAVLTGLALAAVITVGAVVGTRSVSDSLRPQAVEALVGAGLDDIVVKFSGREAELSGGTPAELTEAELIVEAIAGVRWASFDGVAAAAVDAPVSSNVPSLILRRTADGLAIDGVVSGANPAAELKAGAAQTFGATVTGDVAVDPAVGKAAWVRALPSVFGDLVTVKDLKLVIDGGGAVRIGGDVKSQASADKIVSLIAAALPDLAVVSEIDVEPGNVVPKEN